jgi:HK97 family phage prohead protease
MERMTMSKEFRNVEKYEIRESVTEEGVQEVEIEGYFAKFDSLTELWEGFFEKIDRNAFNDTLADGHNIFLLYHHHWDKPLASTQTGTLELSTDNIGLRFKAIINSNLSYAKDTLELIRQGLIQGCSFGFNCIEEGYNYNKDTDTATRTLKKIALYEGSVLCIPQYEDTTVFARAKEIDKTERNKIKQLKENEIRKRKLAIELELA